MIPVALTAMPRRTTVPTAKATVLTGLVLVAGTVAVPGSVLAGRLILPCNGFTPAHGYPLLLSLANGPYLRAAAGSVLYLIGLLGLGIATAIRDSAAATGVALGLLLPGGHGAGLADQAGEPLEPLGVRAARRGGLDDEHRAGGAGHRVGVPCRQQP